MGVRMMPLITDFSAGELAPNLWGRVDREVYARGASKMLNYMPRKQGGFRKRPGFVYQGHTASDNAAFLFSIKVGVNLSYVLEFTVNKIRFWKYTNGALTYVSGQDATTTYTAAECSQLQVAWMYPDLFIAHQNHAPARVRYAATDTFTYSNISFVTTTYTFTANTVNGSNVLSNLSNTSIPSVNDPNVDGTKLWLLTGTGIPNGTYLTAVYPSATASQSIAALSATMNNNATATNTGVTLTLTEQPTVFGSSGNYPRCVCSAFSRVWWANTVNNPQNVWSSIVGVWDSTDPLGASAKMNMNSFEGIIYNQSVMVTDSSGNPTTNPPSYTNQQLTNNTVDDSDSIQITLSETNSEILWLAAGRDLIVGCADGEEVIPAISTANNVSASVVGRTGSVAIQAAQMNDGIVFVQLASQRVYLLNWMGAYILTAPPRDLTFFSSHLFRNNTITYFDYVQAPDTILYFLRTDGTLACCLFDPGYQVQSWYQMALAGSGVITGMCIVGGTDRDVLVVSATYGSSNYIMTLATPEWSDVKTAVYMDAATESLGNETAQTTIAVDSSFNGKTLNVVGDGQYLGTASPSGGSLTLPGGASAKNIIVGYAYNPEADTLPLTTPGKYGTGALAERSVDHVRLMYYNTLDLQVAYKRGDGVLTPVQSSNFNQYNVNVPNPIPQTGVDKIPVDSSTEMQTILVFTSQNPLPSEVVVVVPEVSLED
jgi:hypothetical protein